MKKTPTLPNDIEYGKSLFVSFWFSFTSQSNAILEKDNVKKDYQTIKVIHLSFFFLLKRLLDLEE